GARWRRQHTLRNDEGEPLSRESPVTSRESSNVSRGSLTGNRGDGSRLTNDYRLSTKLFQMRAGLLALAFTQSLLLPKPSTLQHITVAASASAATVGKGGTVMLWADVTPKTNIHFYATDREGLTPLKLVLTPQ